MKGNNKMIKNLKLEVIATYEDGEQEMFQTKLTEDVLKNETSLLNFVRSILDYATDSDLLKFIVKMVNIFFKIIN